MSGFDIESALNGMAALVTTITGVEAVQIGAPESLSVRIAVWITIGDPGVIEPREIGIYELPLNIVVWMGYVVEGSEQAAEAQLADYITGLVRAVIQNRMGTVGGVTRNLNGSVDRMELPSAAAGTADYTLMAGAETRTFPLAIRVIQRENLGV
jgi:hypothetical protein